MKKPLWIVFEGIDGSGKTTQAKLLSDYLNRIGVGSRYKHVFDSQAGRLLREMFINNSFSNTVEILILCAARQAFLDETAAEETDYDVIIIDRFFLSILAMQGQDDEAVELINYIKGNICGEREQPVVFHMNTSPVDCKKRMISRNLRDRIEEKDVGFHRVVSERYLALLRNEEHAYQFDGNGDIASVHRAIVDRTLDILDSRSLLPADVTRPAAVSA